jgi:hypothetical protein
MSVQPGVFDLIVYRGTTMEVLADVEGLDLTGATASVECELPVSAQVITGPDLNQLRLRLTPSQTASAQPGRYPYEAYVTIGSDIHMLLMGHITISEGVIA